MPIVYFWSRAIPATHFDFFNTIVVSWGEQGGETGSWPCHFSSCLLY